MLFTAPLELTHSLRPQFSSQHDTIVSLPWTSFPWHLSDSFPPLKSSRFGKKKGSIFQGWKHGAVPPPPNKNAWFFFQITWFLLKTKKWIRSDENWSFCRNEKLMFPENLGSPNKERSRFWSIGSDELWLWPNLGRYVEAMGFLWDSYQQPHSTQCV